VEVTITAKEKKALDARGGIPRPHRGVLEAAGLSPEEIALAGLFYECPTPAGVPDSVRFAVWGLNYLPPAGDELTPAVYYATTWSAGSTPAQQLEHWLGAAERAQAREGGEEPCLFGILRKLLRWCREYEEQHPYQPEYGWPSRRKKRKKARASEPGLVTVELPGTAPGVTVRVQGEQLKLL